MQALLRTMFKTVLWHATWWRHVAMYVGMLAGVLEVWDVCISRHWYLRVQFKCNKQLQYDSREVDLNQNECVLDNVML